MDNITSIHGAKVEGQPSEAIVETLEMLLEQARSGEVVGFAYAVVRGTGPNNTSLGTGWDGEGVEGLRYNLGCAIGLLQHRYMQCMLEERD